MLGAVEAGNGRGPQEAVRTAADLLGVLDRARDHVIDDAVQALTDRGLQHYEEVGGQVVRQRFAALYGLFLDCLGQHTLDPIRRHGETIAQERFAEGFDIAEVLTAVNLLDEAIWRVVVTHLPQEGLAEARVVVNAALGAGKDTLARTWVSMASEQQSRNADHHLVTAVVQAVGDQHRAVPKELLEEMAREELAKTADARIQGHRLPLAHHAVTERAAAWERSQRTGGE